MVSRSVSQTLGGAGYLALIAQLSIYLAGLGAVYYSLIVRSISNYQGKLFAYLSLLLLGFIAIFRGGVGTDTAEYERMVGILRSPSDWYGVEPGFAVLAWLLGQLSASDVVVVRLLAVVFVGSLLVYLYKADRDETFYLLAYFLPVSFYQYSMNALRIGLASSLLLLAVQYFLRYRDRLGFAYAFFGCLFHYSLPFSVAYLCWVGRMLSPRAIFLFFGFGAALAVFVLFFYGDYLLLRVLSYGDKESPSELSGLSTVASIFVVILGVSQSSLTGSQRRLLGFSGLLFVVFFALFARFTYAGLRFLDLLEVAFPLAVLLEHGRVGRALNWKLKLSMVVAGLISAAAMLRGFLLSADKGSTPWLPFEWIF